MNKYVNFLLGLTLLGVVAAGFFFIRAPSPGHAYIVNGKLDYAKAVTYWSGRIDSLGPEKAYAEMLQEAHAVDSLESSEHIISHSFGEALYSKGDLSNIVYCGNGELISGCYHQFTGLAVEEHGASVLETLKKSCEEKLGSIFLCSHGIGHGLLYTYGYTLQGLQTALQKCNTFYAAKERNSCADGAFMEYFVQEITTLRNGGIPRSYSKEDTYYTCMHVSKMFEKECVFRLPPWWKRAAFPSTIPTEELFAALGDLCRGIPTTHAYLIPTCFLGVGNLAAYHAHYSPEKTALYCAIAGASSHILTLKCLASASKTYWENNVPYEAVCNTTGLTAAEKDYCLTYTTLLRYKAFELVAP